MADLELRTAIEGIVESAGQTDPYAVVDQLVELHGEKWAREQAATRYREVIALARASAVTISAALTPARAGDAATSRSLYARAGQRSNP